MDAPAVTKVLNRRALQADEFEFKMTAEPSTGITLPENARNAADGTVAFDDIIYDARHLYHYDHRGARDPGERDLRHARLYRHI